MKGLAVLEDSDSPGATYAQPAGLWVVDAVALEIGAVPRLGDHQAVPVGQAQLPRVVQALVDQPVRTRGQRAICVGYSVDSWEMVTAGGGPSRGQGEGCRHAQRDTSDQPHGGRCASCSGAQPATA